MSITTIKVYLEETEMEKAILGQEFVGYKSQRIPSGFEMDLDFEDVLRPYEYKGTILGVVARIISNNMVELNVDPETFAKKLIKDSWEGTSYT